MAASDYEEGREAFEQFVRSNAPQAIRERGGKLQKDLVRHGRASDSEMRDYTKGWLSGYKEWSRPESLTREVERMINEQYEDTPGYEIGRAQYLLSEAVQYVPEHLPLRKSIEEWLRDNPGESYDV